MSVRREHLEILSDEFYTMTALIWPLRKTQYEPDEIAFIDANFALSSK